MSRFFRLRSIEVDLGHVLVQIVAVALGVILGLAATNWSEGVHQRALQRATVANIVQELAENQTGLRAVMAPHAKALAILGALTKRASRTGFVSLSDGRAALKKMGPFPENVPLAIAWQIAQSDQGLTLFPYQDRYDLAWIYQLQTIYYQDEERYNNALFSLTMPADGNYFLNTINFANELQAIVSMERKLDGEYTQAIAKANREFGSR